jgi:sugar phosphate permease
MRKVFYGWWIVLATSLVHFWGSGTFFYGFTAYFNPLVEEFGWSYAATSFAASLRSIEGGIAAPLVGLATDRFGSRRLMILGCLLSAVGFFLFSRVETLWGYYLTFFTLSVGSSLFHPVPAWTAVAHWFVRKRGTALGILSAAVGLGGGLVYVVNALIKAYGWRTSLVLIAVGTVLLGIPCSLVVRSKPEPYGLAPDGATPENPDCVSANPASWPAASPSQDFSLREALRTKAFWGIALASTVQAGSLHAVSVHIMPYLLSLNFSRDTASLLAASLILVSVVGRFWLGWLSNRLENRYLLALSMAFQILGLFFLTLAKDIWMAILFIALYGPGSGGGVTVRLTMQAQYFGRLAFGAIQGAFMAIVIAGTISTPLLTGVCYDLYQDYRPAWFSLLAISLAVIPIILKIRPPQKDRRPV